MGLTNKLAARRGQHGKRQVLVGFAAETDTSQQVARAKLARKGCDLLVVNPVGNGLGFGTPDNLRKHFGRALRTTPQAYRRAFRATTATAPAR